MQPRTRTFTIIAQDPAFRSEGKIVTAKVDVPAEQLWPGPMGYRLYVIDYDSTTDTLYKAYGDRKSEDPNVDRFENMAVDSDALLANPHFHQQNVYAIAMATLGKFEQALGRRIDWRFNQGGHQLKIAPHAFKEANAFYSRNDESLLFGYFTGKKSGDTIYACLSHDVVVHETTHAILDGLRPRFMYPSSPDQAAFHEGFSDVIAILSVFRLPEVMRVVFPKCDKGYCWDDIEPIALKKSAVFKLGEEMGKELSEVRGSALRESANLNPAEVDLNAAEFEAPHRRGEVLVAAVLGSLTEIWSDRLKKLDALGGPPDRERIIEVGADTADRLLTTVIRAVDYTPPVDLLFGDFLSALLTADFEVNPIDHLDFRTKIKYVFRKFGVEPAAKKERAIGEGMWGRPLNEDILNYSSLNRAALTFDKNEVFRFVWENRELLRLFPTYTYVQSVRPSTRIGEDGLTIEGTVAEYVQVLTVRADELNTPLARGQSLNLQRPSGCPADEPVKLYGGGVLVFDDFGRLKLHIRNRLDSDLQQDRINYVWRTQESLSSRPSASFAELHAARSFCSLPTGGK